MTNKELMKWRRYLRQPRLRQSLAILRALGGPLRFKIALILNSHRAGVTVTELADILDASLSRVSHQLRILRQHQLVIPMRKNREILYKLANHRIRKFFPF